MPWTTQLDNYYNSFGNGYVPYFAVIGADYIYLHGSNNVSGAINATENAMTNMANISVVQPIGNLLMDANSTDTVDISSTFLHSQGTAMTYEITDNTNPDCCSATLAGMLITLNSQVIPGITQITVTASAGSLSAEETFSVTVLDTYPAPQNPTGEIDFPEVHLSWQEPDTILPITGWNVYRDNVLLAQLPDEELSYIDVPPAGDFVYTFTTQYILVESGPSIPVNISIYSTTGDIDTSMQIDCYDASLILHYVAGIAPPQYPFPWEEWRLELADVDGNNEIEAYDASLLLQYIVELIDEI
ncbi:MAG: dockerin type I repeat-containing protein [Candidatus Cloacimonetes bacterium]|nr:dockerin type I repeat-containing protein [Candidatus Cloacimonadota bacterium]